MHDERSIEERLEAMRVDPALELSVDGNAIGGLLAEVFNQDVTSEESRCRHCDTVSVVGTLRVYMRGPGVVVRCPACTEVMLRFVQLPTTMMVDVTGQRNLYPYEG